jgi:signal transduction histidine kinase
VWPAARAAGRALIQVLVGPDPDPGWRSRPPWQRRVTYGGLGAATVLLGVASLACLSQLANLISNLQMRRFTAVVPAATGSRPRYGVIDAQAFPAALPGHGFAALMLRPGGPLEMALGALVAVAVLAPLPLAARYPLLGWRIGWLALLLVPLTGEIWWGRWPWDPVQILILVVVFCVAGVRHPRPVLCWMWALTLVPWWLEAGPGNPSLVVRVLGTIAFTAVTIAADSVGSRRHAQHALADQAEQTELEQARRAVLEERAKLARELHDVVAHHMSLIAVRAETAPYRLAGLPEPVREEFGSLSGAAREALADMRRLLGVLRHDEPAHRAPQPQLADLPVLIETARQAGVPVELSAPPALDRVPSGVGMCAYRIVQESLSNASRHAPGAAVTVSVDRCAAAMMLRVANGPGKPAGTGQGPGHGLAGMRERVALLGGSMSAGPSQDGGFIVTAVLPLGLAA